MTVAERDPVLDKVIRYIDPTVPVNVTFKKQFTTSVYKVCVVTIPLPDIVTGSAIYLLLKCVHAHVMQHAFFKYT